VIERRRLPGRRVVAGIAGLRESCRNMVRIGGSLKILQMTGDARGRGQVVVVIDMAIRALPRRNGMRAG
jgi:hypothetical protein